MFKNSGSALHGQQMRYNKDDIQVQLCELFHPLQHTKYVHRPEPEFLNIEAKKATFRKE
jgi:hypothetical protein